MLLPPRLGCSARRLGSAARRNSKAARRLGSPARHGGALRQLATRRGDSARRPRRRGSVARLGSPAQRRGAAAQRRSARRHGGVAAWQRGGATACLTWLGSARRDSAARRLGRASARQLGRAAAHGAAALRRLCGAAALRRGAASTALSGFRCFNLLNSLNRKRTSKPFRPQTSARSKVRRVSSRVHGSLAVKLKQREAKVLVMERERTKAPYFAPPSTINRGGRRAASRRLASFFKSPFSKACLRCAKNSAPLAQQTQQPHLRPQIPSCDSNETIIT